MKKYLIIILSFFSFCLVAESRIDSLRTKITNSSGLEKYKYYNSLSFAFQETNVDSSLYYANIALKEFIKTDSTLDIIKSYLNLFESNLSLQNYNEADKCISEMLETASKSKDFEENLFFVYTYVGGIYDNKARSKQAIHYYLEGYKYAVEKMNLDEQASFAFNIGSTYANLRNFKESLIYLIEALKLYEQLEDKERIIGCYNGLGNIYMGLEAYDKAYEYYLKVYNNYKNNDDEEGIAVITFNIGNIYQEKKQYDKALEYFEIAYEIDMRLDNKRFLAMDIINIGEALKGKKEFARAIDYFNQALEIYRALKDEINTISPLLSLSDLYKETGEYKSSKKFADSAQKIAIKHGIDEYDILFKEIYSEIFFKMGLYKKSAQNYKEYTVIKDSLFNSDLLKMMSNIHSMYEVEKREKEIELLKTENVLQEMTINKNKTTKYFFIIILGFMVLAFFTLIIWFRNRRKAHLLMIEQQKKLRKSLEMLSVAQNELVQAEQKNSLLAMAVTANHEINQPLMVIKGNLDLFDMKLQKMNNDAFGKYIKRINESIEKITKILAKYKKIDHFQFTNYAANDQMIQTFSSEEDDE